MENQKLPNATAVLVLGIFSIITCCCYGVIGLVLGIIGLLISKKDIIMYRENSSAFTNYNNLNIGRILCIIGIVLNVLTILYFVWFIATFGLDSMQDQELLQQRIREYFK
ncbi:CCC motif membrane protein [Flavobacterium sp. J27]|uniref:CCC motif membrane protein n=1 Tax=Flavobacterium sp. J27 TaxID=2060419 RepID=UPI0010321035|nr:CCC motif membrane protein [Flavobacterium sp. J27]